jgi:hypothetical protein
MYLILQTGEGRRVDEDFSFLSVLNTVRVELILR